MSDGQKPGQSPKAEGKKGFSLRNIFYHNTFVLVFSFFVALITWFAMAMGNTESNIILRDVPITVQYSPAAEADGLRVFNMSYNTADLEISGSSLITNKLGVDDFEVTTTLNPTSTKLTGNTLQKATTKVRAVKKSATSDYSIAATSPEEVVLEYDRYKEVSFPIENEIKYSADSGYTSGAVTLSEEQVTVAGPESAVNKISRAAVSYSSESPLRADASFTCPVRLYDQNNQEIGDTAGMYLEMSVDSVDVAISILPKKTVSLKAALVNQPKSFSDSRITIEPAQIDIAGPAEVLEGITEITLDTPINFSELDVDQKNVITSEIPLPAGVRDISVSGENTVSQATVTINLNGYKALSVTVPESNIQITNPPVGKTPRLMTRLLEVTVIGPEAQASKLTGDSLAVQADLTNFADRTGTVDVPVTAAISGSGSDSCWVLGKYSVSLSLTDSAAALTAAGQADPEDSVFSEAVNATPQE